MYLSFLLSHLVLCLSSYLLHTGIVIFTLFALLFMPILINKVKIILYFECTILQIWTYYIYTFTIYSHTVSSRGLKNMVLKLKIIFTIVLWNF